MSAFGTWFDAVLPAQSLQSVSRRLTYFRSLLVFYPGIFPAGFGHSRPGHMIRHPGVLATTAWFFAFPPVTFAMGFVSSEDA